MPVKNHEDFTVIAIQKIIRILDEQGVATAKDLVGVTESEIKKLEKFFNVSLPEAYRQYLTLFGRSAGFLSPWMAIYYDDLKEVREVFDMSIAQGLEFRLPANAFIISNFESTFDFFICKSSHDPAVFRVDLRAKVPEAKRFSPSFSAYLETLALNSDVTAIPEDLYDDDLDDAFGDLMNY